ncbi:hypothetical protein [Roseobacter litoralis]|uniref:hypothetical protein n=1 Tax=Roseobacter litoralis TaxID=42443 RepID=UPI002494A04F|nr:hypothetical protein [Roseobacter litoralis]
MIIVKNIALAAASLLSLLWPLWLNGGLYLFADSGSYLQGTATGFQYLFGIESNLSESWRLPETHAPETPTAPVETAVGADGQGDPATSNTENQQYAVSDARSPYFGAVAFLTSFALGHIGLALFSALILMLAVLIASRLLLGSATIGTVCILALSTLTPLPFFVCFLMPDVYAGIVILTSSLILMYRRDWRWTSWLLLTALMAMCTMFHTSHLLLVWAISVAGTPLVLLLCHRLPLAAFGATALVTVASISGGAVFDSLVERIYESEVISPPFLAARLIADGPGYWYLRNECDAVDSIFCDYIDRFPVDAIDAGEADWYSDTFLWSPDLSKGVFSAAPLEAREQMSDEHFTFAASVVAHYPVEVGRAIITNFATQLIYKNGLSEFMSQSRFSSLFQAIGEPLTSSGMTETDREGVIRSLQSIYPAIFWLAVLLCILLWRSARPRIPSQEDTLRVLVLLLFGGVMANALITGGLSGPHDRYNARVLWLPLLSALFFVTHLNSRGPSDGTAL